MSIIIHFNAASFIPSSVKLPSAPSIIKAKAAMVPGIDHSDRAVMTDESSKVDVATSNTLFAHSVNEFKSNHVLGSCFGLPYQDHNYGAPPPPTPDCSPCASPAQTNGLLDEDTNLSVVSTSTANEETPDASITRCICGFEHDDEYMICCDHCSVWQHVDCMGLDRTNIPETYLCEKCQPRKVDRHKAKILQARKSRRVIASDSSETEDDHEVKNSEKKTQTRSRRRKKIDEKLEKHDHVSMRKSKNFQKHKERIEAKRSRLRRTKNKESTSTADEEAQDAWEISREWCEKNFEIAITNQYTPEVQLFAKTLPIQGQEDKIMELLLTRHCQILNNKDKRLISIYDIPRDQPLIEYVGKFLLSSQFHELHPAFSKKLFPFVMFYKVGQEEFCVDASVYGNEARFVRRSCKPNAELRHLVYNGHLHLYVSSTKAVFKDDEITLPFDFSSKENLKDTECACDSEDCILKLQLKNGLVDVCHEKKKVGKKFNSSADDDSSQSVLSSGASPTKAKHGKSALLSIEHTDGKSETENEEPVSDKKKTREERKIDAIMRAFDQMEKAAKRRQQAKHKSNPTKSEDSIEKPEISITPPDISVKEEKVIPPVTISEPVCTEEKPHVLAPKHKKGKRRRGSGSTLTRRRTRTNSGCSDIVSPEENLQPKNESVTTANIEISTISTSTETLSVTTTCTPSTADSQSSMSPTVPLPSPVLKTKRFLLHEWLLEKSEANVSAPLTSPVTVRSDAKWNTAVTSTTYSQCTKYNPNSGGISAAHLRRSSTSVPLKSIPIKSCCEQGSAKKRWLRQAMCDNSSYEDPLSIDTGVIDNLQLENGCFSPSSHGEIDSPGAADDTITPLKKRKLMRESLDSTCCPLSPSAQNMDINCPILSPNEEISVVHVYEAAKQQSSLSEKTDLNSDVSISSFTDNGTTSESNENPSDLLVNEDSSHSLIKTLDTVKTLSEIELAHDRCKQLESSMQSNCDHLLEKHCNSALSNCITSVNISKSSPASVNTMHSSVIEKKIVQSTSVAKALNSPSQETSTVLKVHNENLTCNFIAKRKIRFSDENSSASQSVSDCCEASDFHNLCNPKASLSNLESCETLCAGCKHSLCCCESALSKTQNNILNEVPLAISSVCTELTSKDPSHPSTVYSSMQTDSPVKFLNDSVNVPVSIKSHTEVIENCSKDVSCHEKKNFSSNHANNNEEKSPQPDALSPLLSENSNTAKKHLPSVTQKRKVSLSEYRKRMQDGTVKRSSCEKSKSVSSLSAVAESGSKSVTLAPLPLFDIITNSKSPSPPASLSNKDLLKVEDDVIEHRENLAERLKREFGFDDDLGSSIDNSSSTQHSSNHMKLSVSAQPPSPPPPPPPLPRTIRPYKNPVCLAVPPASPSQYGFAVPTHFRTPSYIISQAVTGAQFIPVQQAVPAPVLSSVHPMTAQVVQAPLVPSSHSYTHTLPRSILHPPVQQHEYVSVSAQNYAALVQHPPPPPPPKSFNQVYLSGLYK